MKDVASLSYRVATLRNCFRFPNILSITLRSSYRCSSYFRGSFLRREAGITISESISWMASIVVFASYPRSAKTALAVNPVSRLTPCTQSACSPPDKINLMGFPRRQPWHVFLCLTHHENGLELGIAAPFCARSVLMCSHDSAVDHQPFSVGICC